MAERDVEDEIGFSSQDRDGTGSSMPGTIASIIPGGPWLLAKLNAARRSPAGQFVRWHRERLVRVCGATLCAALGSGILVHSGLLPSVKQDAWSPAVAAAIAGLLAMSTRICFALWDLARLATSAVTTMLTLIGTGMVAAVLFWDRLGPTPPWTLNEAMAQLRGSASTIGSFMVGLWIILTLTRTAFSGFGFRSNYATYRAATFDYEMAARHEASHALVAFVLGIAVDGAWVVRVPGRDRVGGAVSIPPPVAANTAEALYSLLARKLAVDVAGVAGARGSWSMDAILGELQDQSDWIGANELNWIARSIRPHRNLRSEILNAIVPALRTKPWQDAIEQTAKMLLRAKGALVPPEVFAVTARRFGLALPSVEAIASGCL